MRLAVDALVVIAVALNLACAVGVMVMKDAYQRLHYLSPPASLSPLLLALALFLGHHDHSAGAKMLVVFVLLNAVNGVVSHATARAIRAREQLPLGRLGDDGPEA